MTKIENLTDALRAAKEFVEEAGIPLTFCTLEGVRKEENKYVVTFEYVTLVGPNESITVELDEEGNVIGYERKKPPFTP